MKEELEGVRAGTPGGGSDGLSDSEWPGEGPVVMGRQVPQG